jgi:hypothetical protein
MRGVLMASFWFIEALEQRHKGTLDMDSDTLHLHLVKTPSVWTIDDTETSLSTTLGDELSVVGYSPVAITTTIASDSDSSDIQVTTPVAFGNLTSGETAVAAILGHIVNDIPIAYLEFTSPRSTTGGAFNVAFATTDLYTVCESTTDFWFIEALKDLDTGDLDMDGDTITAYLLSTPSTWTPDKTETSLTTARGDELTGYTPVTATITVSGDVNSSNCVVSSPVTFSSVTTGQTIHAVLLGKSSSTLPISYHRLTTPVTTTGTNVEITFSAADLICKNE